MTAYRITGEIKINRIVLHLESCLKDKKSKIILFAYHKTVLDNLETHIKNMPNINYVRIDGKTSES